MSEAVAPEEATPIIMRRVQREVSELREDTNRRFGEANGRLDETNKRLESLEKTVQAGFEGMGRWLETIVRTLHEEFRRGNDEGLSEIRGRLTAVENRVFRSARPKPKKH